MRIKELFNTMYKLSNSCVFGLVNHRTKMVYISYSKDVCTSLARLLRDIHSRNIVYKQMIKDAPKLEFVKLENINIYDGMQEIHLKVDYHIGIYKQLGYSLYNYKHRFQKLKVKIQVEKDYRCKKPYNNDLLVYVKLVSALRKTTVVGVFNTMLEAEEFVSSTFDGMDIVKPVYSINDLTKDYIKIFLNRIKSHI